VSRSAITALESSIADLTSRVDAMDKLTAPATADASNASRSAVTALESSIADLTSRDLLNVEAMVTLSASVTQLTQRVDDIGASALRGDIAELSSRVDGINASDGGLTLLRVQLKAIEDNVANASSNEDISNMQSTLSELGAQYDEMHRALVLTQQGVVRITHRCTQLAKALPHSGSDELRQQIEHIAQTHAELRSTCAQEHARLAA
jgi:hypothetical protein